MRYKMRILIYIIMICIISVLAKDLNHIDRGEIFFLDIDGSVDIIYQNAIETFGWEDTYGYDDISGSHIEFISLMERIGSTEGYDKLLEIINLSIQRAEKQLKGNPSLMGISESLSQNYRYREWFKARHNL